MVAKGSELGGLCIVLKAIIFDHGIAQHHNVIHVLCCLDGQMLWGCVILWAMLCCGPCYVVGLCYVVGRVIL